MPLWTDIISGLTGPVATYFTRRAELKAAQHQADLDMVKAQGDRQASLVTQGLAADAAWEQEFARQAATSWKDEAELIVISIPLVLCFTPYSYIVQRGFEAIKGTPSWFQFLVITIYLANYGIRYWRKTQTDT